VPYADLGGLRLYYEIQGSGNPLIMIMGLGADSSWWPPRLLSLLSREFRLIVFDNRGAGRSDKPDEPYTVKDMAGDVVGLMDYLGVERAHILGVSMGGMIAQELAISHPERVSKLVLVSTGPGGSCGAPPRPEAMEHLLMDRAATPLEVIVARTIEALFPREWLEKHREEVEELARRISRHPIPAYSYARQLEAAMSFDACDRLGLIKAPTLVVSGGKDLILPPENARVLAERIPKARLVIFEDSGHGLIVQRLDDFARLVADFLKEDP